MVLSRHLRICPTGPKWHGTIILDVGDPVILRGFSWHKTTYVQKVTDNLAVLENGRMIGRKGLVHIDGLDSFHETYLATGGERPIFTAHSILPPRILVLSTCTGSKRIDSPNALTDLDFSLGQDHIASREQALSLSMLPASRMYTGQQHLRLMKGINDARDARADITLKILSAGYGFIDETRPIAPYECSFSSMSQDALAAASSRLAIPDTFRALASAPYDLAIVMFGKEYWKACAVEGPVTWGGPTVILAADSETERFSLDPNARVIPLGNDEAKRFSCGLVALKGEIASRILLRYAHGALTGNDIVAPHLDMLQLLDKDFSPPPREPARLPRGAQHRLDFGR